MRGGRALDGITLGVVDGGKALRIRKVGKNEKNDRKANQHHQDFLAARFGNCITSFWNSGSVSWLLCCVRLFDF
jgi:hypothetical protein